METRNKHWKKVIFMGKKTKYSLLAMLILQVVLTVYFGMHKNGYHLDEMYTYTLANYDGGFVTETEGVLEGWKSGEFYKDVLEVSQEEAFSYNIPYQNQRGDVHPPLYYFVIHTVSSLMSETFSKWIGISVNILFNVLSSFGLFWVARKISKNDKLALIITGVWALSNGVIESGIFARMYAMLTFFAISLVALHKKAYEELKEKDKISMAVMLLLLACTVCGVLTQYYYMVFCFFLCGIFAFYLFFQKKWNTLMRYVTTEFGALMISVVCFPYMLKHIFRGYRGKQAFQSALEMQGYGGVLKSVTTFISEDLFNGFGEEIAILIVAVLLIIVVKKVLTHKEIKISEEQLMTIALAAVAIGYVLVIAKVAPFQANRYFMCVYPLLTLAITLGGYYTFGVKYSKNSVAIIGILCCVLTGSSYFVQDVEYLYLDCAIREEQLEVYQGTPAIILNGSYEYAPDNWIYEFGNYDAVYRCDEEYALSGLTNAAETYDIADGFLLYAYGINDDEEVLLEKLREHLPIDQFELVTDIRCRVYYCTLANS